VRRIAGLKEFRTALDGRDLQGAAFENVILVVPQIFGSEGGLLLCCFFWSCTTRMA